MFSKITIEPLHAYNDGSGYYFDSIEVDHPERQINGDFEYPLRLVRDGQTFEIPHEQLVDILSAIEQLGVWDVRDLMKDAGE